MSKAKGTVCFQGCCVQVYLGRVILVALIVGSVQRWNCIRKGNLKSVFIAPQNCLPLRCLMHFKINSEFLWKRNDFKIFQSVMKCRSIVMMYDIAFHNTWKSPWTLPTNSNSTHLVVAYLIAFVVTAWIALQPYSPPEIFKHRVLFKYYIVCVKLYTNAIRTVVIDFILPYDHCFE